MRTSIMMRCPKCAENSQLDNIHLLDHTFKREWVGLTAEEAAECWTTSATQTWKNFEAKLKDKNNG